MWSSFFRHYSKLISLVGVFTVLTGCAGSPKGYEAFKQEGLQNTVPDPGTRVVVRGNQAGAVNQALGWLSDHGLLVVNRRVDREITAPQFALRNEMEQQGQVLAAARRDGATFVVFVQVDETPLNTPVDPNSVASELMNSVVVNIQGMNAKTGEVAFGAQAWNAEPLPASGSVVQDLTILALEKAWQESTDSLSGQPEMAPGIAAEQKIPQAPESVIPPGAPTTRESATVHLEPSAPPDETQSVQAEATATTRAQATVSLDPVAEEVPSAPDVEEPMVAENSETSDDPSLGLQVASGALSVLYVPVKVVYAGLGGVIGGMVYLVTAGNESAAQSVWDASFKGDYWLTPDHLQGNEPVHFKGEAGN